MVDKLREDEAFVGRRPRTSISVGLRRETRYGTHLESVAPQLADIAEDLIAWAAALAPEHGEASAALRRHSNALQRLCGRSVLNEVPALPDGFQVRGMPDGYRSNILNNSKMHSGCSTRMPSMETSGTMTHRSTERTIRECETTTADGPKARHGPRTSFDDAMPPRMALEMLHEGNQRYVDESFHGHHATDQWRNTLAKDGQKPAAVVIGCADSRCPVELLFDCQPGDLFVLRNAGNTCSHAEGSIVGSVEYAIGHLGTQLVLVLGHTKCGAIAGATKTMLASKCPDCPQAGQAKHRPSLLDSMLEGLAPVAAAAASELPADTAEEDVAAHAVKVNIFTTMEKLMGYSKLLRSKVESGEVEVHGGIYDLASGTVEFLGQRPASTQASSSSSGSSWSSAELRHAAALHAGLPHPGLPTADQRAPFLRQHAFVPATKSKLLAVPPPVPPVPDGFRRETPRSKSKNYPCTPRKPSIETSAVVTHRSAEPTISQCETTTADVPNAQRGPRTSFDAALPPMMALEMLREGNQRYVDEDLHGHQATDQWRSTLAKDGQKPAAVVIGCADSRCPIELVFDAQPGDLFVLRNAGNTCSHAEGSIVGSVEYAVGHLGTQLIFILGHTKCGAIAGATKTMLSSKCPGCPQAGAPERRLSLLESMLGGLAPVAAAAASELPPDAAEEDVAAHAVKVNVFTTMNKLMGYSKLLRSKVESGEVQVHGGIYDLASGKVEFISPGSESIQATSLRLEKSAASKALLHHVPAPPAQEPTISQCETTTADVPPARHGPRTSFDAALPPTMALEMLREGNQRYVDEDFHGHHATDQWRSTLAKDGQKPAAVVIGCADSRCPVELVFDAQPGDLFVLRNAGNTCSHAEGSIVGSVEYAIGHLGTQLIFVLGHTKCGAIAGATKTMLSDKCLGCSQAVTSKHRQSLLESMLGGLAPVAAAAASELPADAAEEDVAAHAVKVNVFTTMDKLMGHSKLIRSKVESGEVQVHGGIYDLASGKVEFISQGSESIQVTGGAASKALVHVPAPPAQVTRTTSISEIIDFYDKKGVNYQDMWKAVSEERLQATMEPTINQCETTTADVPSARCGPRTSFDAALPPTVALEMLREGNQRYVDEDFHGHHATDQWRSALAKDGQKPAAVVIGCADSRCPVELVFDAQPGDLFVLRNAGNTCSHAEGSIVGSVEYAIGQLGTQLIFVLGHTKCGAIAGATKTMLSNKCLGCSQAGAPKRRLSLLESMLGGLAPVAAAAASELPADAAEEDVAAHAVKVNVFTTMNKLMGYSKLLRSKVESGEVQVHGGIYDLASGKVEFTSLGLESIQEPKISLCETTTADVSIARRGPRTSFDAALPPMMALEMLREGNQRYVDEDFHGHHATDQWRSTLAKDGQKPAAVVIGCADSRCPVELVFDAQPGDLFVLRNAGNTCSHAEGSIVGSVEYAVGHLGTQLIFVLGHTKCGAIAGATKTMLASRCPDCPRAGAAESRPSLLDSMLGGLAPVAAAAASELPADAAEEDVAAHAVKVNVFTTMDKLMGHSKLLRSKVESGEVQIHGGIYDLASGKVEFISPGSESIQAKSLALENGAASKALVHVPAPPPQVPGGFRRDVRKNSRTYSRCSSGKPSIETSAIMTHRSEEPTITLCETPADGPKARHGPRTSFDDAMPPTMALEVLREGNRRYVDESFHGHHATDQWRSALAKDGQKPTAVVIGCADSRCPIELLFDAQPGDLFVLRNAGNTCSHAEGSIVGSVEYAVGHLGTQLVVVLGHTKCGAIAGATRTMLASRCPDCPQAGQARRRPSLLESMLGGLAPVAAAAAKELPADAAEEDVAAHAVEVNVFSTMDTLIGYSKLLRSKIESGEVEVHGGIYDLASGKVEFLGQGSESNQSPDAHPAFRSA